MNHLQAFLSDQKVSTVEMALRNSINAAFMRARVYAPGTPSNAPLRSRLRSSLATHLRSMGLKYVDQVLPEEHCRNIVLLAATLTTEFKTLGILRCDRFRIGTAQKALNVYLKYMWCLGKIRKPPHCPIDGEVIRQIRKDVAWTKLDDIDCYVYLIACCVELASSRHIADWELEIFQQLHHRRK